MIENISNEEKEAESTTPRIPEAVTNPLGGDKIQVNFCKNPVCANFGAPARTSAVKPGPTGSNDNRYVIQSTADGASRGIRCKKCGEKPPIKSNKGISEEIERFTRSWKQGAGCPNTKCLAYGLDVNEYLYLYNRHGRTGSGTCRMSCRTCGSVFTVGRRAKFYDKDKTEALFLIFVNRSPIKRALETLGWNSSHMGNFYRRFNQIDKKCQEFSAIFDRQLSRGEFELGYRFISTDIQQYSINWDESSERENTLLNAVFSVDNESGFIFCANAAYDIDVDADAVDRETLASEDYKLHEPYRRHARLWTAGDELQRHRSEGQKGGRREQLIARIEEKYKDVISRRDVEDGEIASRQPKKGKLVHYPYTVYASMFILERLLNGAKKVIHCMDQESANRAACLSAFEHRIRKGTAHAFYVKVNKEYTVPQRQKLRNESLEKFRTNYAKLLARGAPLDGAIAKVMRGNIETAIATGPWQDQWVKHPLPRMDEPEKMLCWLTRIGPSVDDEVLAMFLGVSMNGVDNVLQQVRRRISMLERPLKTASAQRAGWNGYGFYKPKNVQPSLNILRCYLNFCVVRERDNKTAAMRLGIAQKPYTIEDILNLSLDHHPVSEEERFRMIRALVA